MPHSITPTSARFADRLLIFASNCDVIFVTSSRHKGTTESKPGQCANRKIRDPGACRNRERRGISIPVPAVLIHGSGFSPGKGTKFSSKFNHLLRTAREIYFPNVMNTEFRVLLKNFRDYCSSLIEF